MKNTPKEKREVKRKIRAGRQALSKIPLSQRIVRILEGRGDGDLYEIVAFFEKGAGGSGDEVILRPWKRTGADVTLYRYHTAHASVQEVLAYCKAKRSQEGT